MMLTILEAAKRVGISKGAISQRIKNGKLSANRNDLGHYLIDEAELLRLYPNYTARSASNMSTAIQATPDSPTYNNDKILIAELRAKLEASEKALETSETLVQDYKERLGISERERRESQEKVTALLEDKREKPRGLLNRLLNR